MEFIYNKHTNYLYETGTAMNARASENYLAISRSSCHAIQTLYIYSNVKLMQLSLSLA
jgi:hypothetical protein